MISLQICFIDKISVTFCENKIISFSSFLVLNGKVSYFNLQSLRINSETDGVARET